MNLDTISDKHLHEIERLTTELLETIRKAKVAEPQLIEMLRTLKAQAEQLRRQRYDAVNPEFRGY
jgi:hypothetical protein